MARFLGKSKEQVLLDADVFIQTSRTEGLPTAVLEAMSYKIPVLITKGTGLYDDIKKPMRLGGGNQYRKHKNNFASGRHIQKIKNTAFWR